MPKDEPADVTKYRAKLKKAHDAMVAAGREFRHADRVLQVAEYAFQRDNSPENKKAVAKARRVRDHANTKAAKATKAYMAMNFEGRNR